MSDQGSGRSCLFCGERPVTNEDVFPRWLSKWFREERGMHGVHLDTTNWGQRTSATLNIKSRRFCEPCNSTWMRTMEDQVKPILVTMMQDDSPRTLVPYGQAILAQWAFKTMLTLLSTQPKEHQPADDIYRAFRLYEIPPRKVFIGHSDNPDTVRFNIKGVTLNDDTPRRKPDAYQVMLLIGRVFLASIYPHNFKVAVQLDVPTSLYAQIWPVQGPGIVWPRPEPVDADDLFRPVKP